MLMLLSTVYMAPGVFLFNRSFYSFLSYLSFIVYPHSFVRDFWLCTVIQHNFYNLFFLYLSQTHSPFSHYLSPIFFPLSLSLTFYIHIILNLLCSLFPPPCGRISNYYAVDYYLIVTKVYNSSFLLSGI